MKDQSLPGNEKLDEVWPHIWDLCMSSGMKIGEGNGLENVIHFLEQQRTESSPPTSPNASLLPSQRDLIKVLTVFANDLLKNGMPNNNITEAYVRDWFENNKDGFRIEKIISPTSLLPERDTEDKKEGWRWEQIKSLVDKNVLIEKKTLEWCLSGISVLKTMLSKHNLTAGVESSEALIATLSLVLNNQPSAPQPPLTADIETAAKE